LRSACREGRMVERPGGHWLEVRPGAVGLKAVVGPNGIAVIKNEGTARPKDA